MVHQSEFPTWGWMDEKFRLFAVCLNAILRFIQLKGHIFPASGQRNNSNSQLNNGGSNGYYWSASANNTNNGHYLNFNSSNFNWNNNNRANGFPVRAVAEAFADLWTLPF